MSIKMHSDETQKHRWPTGKSRLRMMKTRRQGFTLLEIMMVVIIIGIMVSLVVPRLTGRRRSAEIAQAKNQMDAIETSLMMFEGDTGGFPSGDDGLQALIEKPGDVDEEDWNGPYFRGGQIPKDPWSNDYQYVFPGQNSTDFDLWSYGPDKQDGTDDDITNWTKE